jgi:thiaminase
MLPDGCELIISTVGKNKNRAGKVAELARSAALAHRSGLLDEATVTVVENIRENIKNISPARQRFLKEAILAGTGYTEEELNSFSAGYLRYLVKLKNEGSYNPSVSRRAEKYYEIYLRRMAKKAAEKENSGRPKGQGNEG